MLSLQALPRRVTLDFRDIFSEGFTFDEIHAGAAIERGRGAYRQLPHDRHAARVDMKGDLDLARETQKLQVRVIPSLSESVALGAAIVNPAVGLATLFAQKALKDPINQMVSVEYIVTGTWSDPVIANKKREPPNDGKRGAQVRSTHRPAGSRTAMRSGFGRARPRAAAARKPVGERSSGGPPVFRIAGVQMASGPNVAANLNEAERLIEMAVEQGAKLVALPEYFAIMGMKDTDKVEAREKEGKGPIQRFLAETARQHKIWLVGGSDPARVRGGRQGPQQLPGLRRQRQAGGALRQDPPVQPGAGQGAVQRGAHHRAGRGREGGRFAVRPHRPVGLLRPALPRAVPRHEATWTSSSCRRRSPRPPAGRTGRR